MVCQHFLQRFAVLLDFAMGKLAELKYRIISRSQYLPDFSPNQLLSLPPFKAASKEWNVSLLEEP